MENACSFYCLCFAINSFILAKIALQSGRGGGAVAQSVERATPGEVPGLIPAVAARFPLVGSLTV